MTGLVLRRDVLFGVGLFVLLAAVYGGVFLLWQSGHQAEYLALTRTWGIDTWDWPFFDLQGVLSWADCHRLGIDVLRSNPCDPLNRPLNYGPLLASVPFGTRQTLALGLLLDAAFLVAVCFVLRPHTWRSWFLAAAVALSTASLFALERGNLDLLEFVLIAMGCGIAARGPLARGFSYALYFLAGVLKFYPFALVLLVLGERRRVAVLAGIGFAILIGCYVGYYWTALKAVTALMPQLGYDGDTFGARQLGDGLTEELDLSDVSAAVITAILFAVAACFCLWFASALWRQGIRLRFADANSRLLIAGAVIITACFVLQANITYRSIFLLFLVPGLLALRQQASSPLSRWIIALAVASIVFCLWSECLRRGFETGLDILDPDRDEDGPMGRVSLAFFVFRELVWWSLMAFTSSLVLSFACNSPMGRAVLMPAARLFDGYVPASLRIAKAASYARRAGASPDGNAIDAGLKTRERDVSRMSDTELTG